MKKIFLILAITILGLTSCKKEKIEPTPKSTESTSIVLLKDNDTITYDQIVINYSDITGMVRCENYTGWEQNYIAVDSINWDMPFVVQGQCWSYYSDTLITDIVDSDWQLIKNDTIIDTQLDVQDYNYVKQ